MPSCTHPLALTLVSSPTALGSIKNLQSDNLVYIHRKCVVGSFYNYVYVEEPDKSAGIRIDYGGYRPMPLPSHGDLVSVYGTVTEDNGVKCVTAQSPPEIDYGPSASIEPVMLNMAAVMGYPIDPEQPESARIYGLRPIAQRVKVYGNVMARALCDELRWYFYVDDGAGRKDGTVNPITGEPNVGLRIYADDMFDEDFVIVDGVLFHKQVDPTPDGPDGDDIVIPVVECAKPGQLYTPQENSVIRIMGSAIANSVGGQLRLAEQAHWDVETRIYSQRCSTTIENATTAFSAFTLEPINSSTEKISASAPGYLSETIEVSAGEDNIEIVLQPADCYVEISVESSKLEICSGDYVRIDIGIRDCEGKRIPGRTLVVETSLGAFVESQSQTITLTTDENGKAHCNLYDNGSGEGWAEIDIDSYPDQKLHANASVEFVFGELSLSADTNYMDSPGQTNVYVSLEDGNGPVGSAAMQLTTDMGSFQPYNTDDITVFTGPDGTAQVPLLLATEGTALVTLRHQTDCGNTVVRQMPVTVRKDPVYSTGILGNNLVVDLDGAPDGEKEIVFIDEYGELVAMRGDGTELWSKPFSPNSDGNTVASAVCYQDRSQLPCLFVPSDYEKKIYAFSHDGRPLAGWPVGANFRFVDVAPAIGDINLDGTNEVVAGDECCYVFSWNPTGNWKRGQDWHSSFLFRNLTDSHYTTIHGSSCAIGDVGVDPRGMPDVVVGALKEPVTFTFEGDVWGDYGSEGLYLEGWPKQGGDASKSSPAIGDMDGDGYNDVAIGTESGMLYIYTSSDDGWNGYASGGPVRSSPALADLDGDGLLDVIYGSLDGKVYAKRYDGADIDGWTKGITLDESGYWPVESSPVVGDLDSDGEYEIVVGCNNGNIYALHARGRDNTDTNNQKTGPIQWVKCCIPKGSYDARVTGAPTICDLDNDGLLEIVATSRGAEGYAGGGAFVFETQSPFVAGDHPWPTFHHDNQRTGCASPQPEPIYASICGLITQNQEPVCDALVYIYHQDGTPVAIPGTDPPSERGYVRPVGIEGIDEAGKGAYCINQLEPYQTYRIEVSVGGVPTYVVDNINVTTGQHIVDIDIPN